MFQDSDYYGILWSNDAYWRHIGRKCLLKFFHTCYRRGSCRIDCNGNIKPRLKKKDPLFFYGCRRCSLSMYHIHSFIWRRWWGVFLFRLKLVVYSLPQTCCMLNKPNKISWKKIEETKGTAKTQNKSKRNWQNQRFLN